MKKRFQLVAVILCVFLCAVMVLTSCQTSSTGESKKPETAEEPKEAATTEEPKQPETTEEPKEAENKVTELTDMLGRTVVLPGEITKIATPNVDAFRIMVQLGAQDLLIGAPDNMFGSKYSDVDTIEVLTYPEVKEMTKVGGGPPGTEVNEEQIIHLDPDIIISWSFGKPEEAKDKADALQSKTGIPVVCIAVYPRGDDPIKGIMRAYEIMGILTQKEARAKELTDYYADQVKQITDKIKDIPEEEKPKVYNCSVGGPLRATTNYLPLQQLNVNNVATEIGPSGGEVTKEQLTAWNPSVIFVHSPSNVYSFELTEFTDDPVLSTIDAVKENKIYRVKQYYMGWDIATGLCDMNFMAKTLFPDKFEDMDFEQVAEDILFTFYQKEGLFSALKSNSGLY